MFTWQLWNTNKSALNTAWHIQNTVDYHLKYLLKMPNLTLHTHFQAFLLVFQSRQVYINTQNNMEK